MGKPTGKQVLRRSRTSWKVSIRNYFQRTDFHKMKQLEFIWDSVQWAKSSVSNTTESGSIKI
jgi:hypothetical protein